MRYTMISKSILIILLTILSVIQAGCGTVCHLTGIDYDIESGQFVSVSVTEPVWESVSERVDVLNEAIQVAPPLADIVSASNGYAEFSTAWDDWVDKNVGTP